MVHQNCKEEFLRKNNMTFKEGLQFRMLKIIADVGNGANSLTGV